MNIGDVIGSPWGRWVVRRVAPILLQSLERANAYVETDELGPSFTLTGERHEDRRDEARGTSSEQKPVVEHRGVAFGEGRAVASGASHWVADLPPIPGPAPLTLGAQRPGSVRSSTEQWLLCMTFNAFDEGERRVMGGHCHFIAPLDDYPLHCPECVQAKLSSRKKARLRPFAGRPQGPVAIVCGRAVTLGELLADARRRIGFARFPVSAEFPAQENAAKQESRCCPRFTWGDGTHELSCKLHAAHVAAEPALYGAYPYAIRNAAEWREEFTERAAIFEYVGGHTRAVAETMAKELIGACP